ncbi:MAG: helix-turn-helix transcriptional regulator [Alphaproteobacteria bacterium]|nr:helix-turn-helix transcriptional regulator [Alphaproteobacteria bacterium]
MGRTLNEVLVTLPPKRKAAIKRETARLIEEEYSLREIRKALSLTQDELAKELGVGQDEISRIERRADMLVSTLRRVIEGMGGELDIVARFPDHDPVHIANIGDLA